MKYEAWVDGACAVNSTKCGGIGVVLRQRAEVINMHAWPADANNVLVIDRNTPFGNPYAIHETQPRDKALKNFRYYLRDNPDKVALARKLLPKYPTWACWCKPEDCHGDVWNEVLFPDVESSGHYCSTTNNRMELQAAIEAVDMTPPAVDTHLTIYSDSEIVVGGMEWGWKRKANVDLWEMLDYYVDQRGHVDFQHIPRCSTPEHKWADKLAFDISKRHDTDCGEV